MSFYHIPDNKTPHCNINQNEDTQVSFLYFARYQRLTVLRDAWAFRTIPVMVGLRLMESLSVERTSYCHMPKAHRKENTF